jgi:hypothetical protein
MGILMFVGKEREKEEENGVRKIEKSEMRERELPRRLIWFKAWW